MKSVFVLLVLSLAAHGASGDPGKAALDFLEKVRQRTVDLEPGGDTALSQGTGDEKKRQISRRLDRMARDLGNDPLEVGSVKLDEEYAGVLVRKTGGFDPSRLQVFPVALVKRGEEWRVAPVPASFENAGAGYAIALKKRLESLENWMLREQVTDLEKLRAQAAEKMRRRIEGSLTAKELGKMSGREVGAGFLAACRRRDLPAVLGFLGGLAERQPEDWALRLRAADRALGGGGDGENGGAWRLLTSPGVARAVVNQEERGRSGSLSLACLDPAVRLEDSTVARVVPVHFQLRKGDDGLWQVDPPADFLYASDEPMDDPDEGLDLEVVKAFPDSWADTHPPAPQVTAEMAHRELVAALAGPDLEAVLRLVKMEEDATAARASCVRAAEMWWRIHDPAVVSQAVALDLAGEDEAAAGLVQFFSARDPEAWNPEVVHFEKTGAGWLWTPFPKEAAREALKERMEEAARRGQEGWQEKLFSDIPVVKEVAGRKPPTPEEARTVMAAWFDAIRRADLQAALGLIAKLDGAKSGGHALQNLGYEIAGTRRNGMAPVISGIYEGDTWTAVGVKSEQSGKASYPLYAMIRTESGVRILAEADLFAAGNRSRDFLNREALAGVGKSCSLEVATELRMLFVRYQEDVAKRRE